MVDFHIHTSLSHDSQEDMENYVKKAISFGDKTIGFSEHYDYDAYLDGSLALTDLDKYYKKIVKLRKRYPNVEILFGIELGYCKYTVEQFNKVLGEFPFDFVINSVHNVEGRGSFLERYFKGRTRRQAYEHYFNTVLDSLTAGYDYNVVGHLGYVSRYWQGEDGCITVDEYRDILTEIFTKIIALDKCVEVNTSTYGSKDDFLPNFDMIKLYLSLGGKNLSFGSDAHSAKDYNRNSTLLIRKLKSVGVESLCYYKNGRKYKYFI